MTEFWPDPETLLGYALNALSDEEMEAVRQAIATHPALQAEWEEIQKSVNLLSDTAELIEPPAGLVERTLHLIEEQSENDTTGCSEGSVASTTPNPPCRAGLNSKSMDFVWLKRSWMDVLAATAACLVVISLLAPSVLTSRELARRETCSQNLAELGQAICHFAENSNDHRIPAIDIDGPLSFAGAYAIRLNDNQLLESPSLLWCPSIVPLAIRFQLPTEEMLRDAEPSLAERWRKVSGGSYAYNLGFVEGDVYRSHEYQGRESFAILADAPMVRGNLNYFLVHAGQGLNMLFEDGHVSFVRLDKDFGLMDHPFFNRAGLRDAGLDRQDSSLAPSYIQPLRLLHFPTK